MIRNAAGMLNSRMAVTATTNRTMSMLADRIDSNHGPIHTPSSTVTTGPTTSTRNSNGSRIFPAKVRLLNALLTAVIVAPLRWTGAQGSLTSPTWPRRAEGAREHGSERTPRCVSERAERATPGSAAPRRASLVHPAHDRIERGHDGHRVRDQVVPHQQPDELEMHERRVVDLHPERLVGAVRDRVGPVQAARPLDAGPRPAGPRPEQSRQLRHDRPVGHVVQALVDDPQALLDL